MLWACIALPQLALDGVLRRHPNPDAPLALVTGPAQRRVLYAVNAAAAAHGLRAGQGLAAAQALLADFQMIDYRAGARTPGPARRSGPGRAGGKPARDSDPQTNRPADDPHDRADALRWQAFLAAWAYRYSSKVSVDFPDAVVLEVGASLGLFGPWPAFERRLRADLEALGFRHRIAVAPTARAAWVLAGACDGVAIGVDGVSAAGEGSAISGGSAAPAYGLRPELMGYGARVAAELEKALAAIAVTQARIEPSLAQALDGMGLRRLGQLFALPRDALTRRFGAGLLLHLDRMRGQAPEPMRFYRPPDRFDLRLELSWEVESLQALLFPLRRLTADLAAYLAGRDGGVQRFELHLEHEHPPASMVRVGLLAAERDAALLFDLARGRLEQARVAAPVQAMRLIARELPAFVPGARELFDARPEQAMPWQTLRERLRARLGADAVYGLALADDHRPERAARRVAAPVPAYRLRPGPDRTTPDEAQFEVARTVGTGTRLPRPTWLLPRPIPLRGPAPKLLAGPERLETGWWDGADVRRDYYLVETASGQRAWAFCAPGERGPFMLHGWFA
ncbi:MAG: DNA polymerase Y family protein [Xanthomonadaceae bacterium]|nr:DNA polymerase Y family protein [Xanthomonadaceae bacterium]